MSDKTEPRTLDCQYCHGVIDINKMYSSDACCEEHQNLLCLVELWGERPVITQINNFFVVSHESHFGVFELSGIYVSIESAIAAWNKFTKEIKDE